MAFQGHENDWRRGGEAFVPAGEGITPGRFHDARTHDAAHNSSFGRDQLFAECFGVSVNVGPVPEFGALNAKFSESIARPDFSLARDGQAECIRIVSIAHLFIETLARLFAKVRRHHCVFRFFARAFGHFGAVANFRVD